MEYGVHVPFVISGAEININGPTDSLMDFTDILPTFAEWAGVDLSQFNYDGTSLTSFLRGEAKDTKPVIYSFPGPARLIRTKTHLLEAVSPLYNQPMGKLYKTNGSFDGRGYQNLAGEDDYLEVRREFENLKELLPSVLPESFSDIIWEREEMVKAKEFFDNERRKRMTLSLPESINFMMIRYNFILILYLLNWIGYADFPARIPLKKPVFNISPAVERLYDEWNPHEDRENELYSNFKYSPIEGLERSKTISRRDPSKVILIDGIYHVWYTCRKTAGVPAGKKATEKIPSFDWDLCDIWHATSRDGWSWVEDPVPAITRLEKPNYGWRSISTTDILIWEDKYYLYYQGFNEIPGLNSGDRAAVTVAESDSPFGPWKPLGKVVVDFGKEGEWDSNAIHDPNPIIYDGKIYFIIRDLLKRVEKAELLSGRKALPFLNIHWVLL